MRVNKSIRLPNRMSVRSRLALLYGSIFLLTGAIFLVTVFALSTTQVTKGIFLYSTPSGFQPSTGAINPSNPINLPLGAVRILHNGSIRNHQVRVIKLPSGKVAFHVMMSKRIPGQNPSTIGGASNTIIDGSNSYGNVQVPFPPLPAGVHLSDKTALAQLGLLKAQQAGQLSADRHNLLLVSLAALVLLTLVSIFLGWVLAGRALRPIHRITSVARDISSTNLHARIALEGPNDELMELSTTFDDLLARLERSFVSQKHFVANASHELRTPLARQRALAEVSLDDPDSSVASLKEALSRIFESTIEQESLIEALLTLASAEREPDNLEPVNLMETVNKVVLSNQRLADQLGVTVHLELQPANIVGNKALIERLVENIMNNAIVHNRPEGQVWASLATDSTKVLLKIINDGRIISVDQVDGIFSPFSRLESSRLNMKSGHGLGMSIVSAIAEQHGASLLVTPRECGGLEIVISFDRDVNQN